MFYFISPPKVYFERSKIAISPLEELLPLMPTSIPIKKEVKAKVELKDNKDVNKIKNIKNKDNKKEVKIANKKVEKIRVKEEKKVVVPVKEIKKDRKKENKPGKIKENKPDLKKINEKIWDSIKNEVKHNKEHLDCKKLINGDQNYIKLQSQTRITYKDPEKLLMDCNSIKERNYFADKALSNEENKYPLAYARIVYKDYRFLEAELATNYHPQNFYCFAVDSKASDIFLKRIKSLAKCFPNIIIPTIRYSVDREGHFTENAFMSCLEELSKKQYKWEYIFTLLNYDLQIKTNQEIIKILKLLEGANDVEYEFKNQDKQNMTKSLNNKFNWTFKDLNLFKDEKLNYQVDNKGKPLSLKLSKGYVQTSLARPFVDFITQKLNLNKMIEQLNSWDNGAHELFFQSLVASDGLKAPNGFTHKCIEKKVDVPYITRFSIWGKSSKCHSRHLIKNICIFGIEDLATNIRDSKYLFINKMSPDFDFGAILCWHEEMRSRTLVDKGVNRLNIKYYQNWPQTRFHREILKTGKVNLDKFNCDINIKN